MMQYSTSANPPVILTFSTLDPSGCGGIQADIETAISLGCHCAPVATSMCTSGFSDELDVLPVEAPLLIEQARSILENMDVKAIKIGYLGSVANAEAIHTIIRDYPDIPVIAHPALCLWQPDAPEQAGLDEAFSTLIAPFADIVNLTLHEVRTLVPQADTVDAAAHAFIAADAAGEVFISGTGKEHQQFQKSLYNERGLVRHYRWEQEPPSCHGASSTLASAVAAYLAHGSSLTQAIEQAQNFTWQAMRTSRQLGFGKRTPHRLYWADPNIDSPEEWPAENAKH